MLRAALSSEHKEEGASSLGRHLQTVRSLASPTIFFFCLSLHLEILGAVV